MRISLHPDQFTLINSPDPAIFARSAAELTYHARILDLLGFDLTARYKSTAAALTTTSPSLDRFCPRFEHLAETIRRRLAVENDDHLYSVADCLVISRRRASPCSSTPFITS